MKQPSYMNRLAIGIITINGFSFPTPKIMDFFLFTQDNISILHSFLLILTMFLLTLVLYWLEILVPNIVNVFNLGWIYWFCISIDLNICTKSSHNKWEWVYNQEKPIIIQTDASQYGLSTALLQDIYLLPSQVKHSATQKQDMQMLEENDCLSAMA